MQKLLPLFALSLAVAGSALGVTYTDDFSTNPGALNGRTTAVGFGNWIAETPLSVQSGTGIYQSSSAAYTLASLSLPAMDAASTITVSLTMKPTGTSGNLIAFGFTNLATQPVTSTGNGLAFLAGSGAGDPGLVAVAGGYSVSGDTLNYDDPFLAFDGALPTTLNLSYTIGTGQFSVSATNGLETVIVFDGLTHWNPGSVGGAPFPIPNPTYFQYFTIQFEGQTTGLSGGNISNLTVSVVPEPSAGTYILGAVAAFGVVALIRRRRAALIG